MMSDVNFFVNVIVALLCVAIIVCSFRALARKNKEAAKIVAASMIIIPLMLAAIVWLPTL